ncbi:Uncharacterized protein OBRU01_17118 [Operophtera brumata]|uniref:Uncharacterized protein n=1 Tax=Operophtera brumata TaxID=104452 RepID=A0A0L7KRA6_OPEBR|nr:Uncharacterized protein OBRU01_17118 [Operophtera brumata]
MSRKGFEPASSLGKNAFGSRGKLSGVHAGLVFLAPLGENPSETLETAHSGHTPLEPPSSILHSVYSAIKNVFTGPVPSDVEPYSYQPPPPPQPFPQFKPMAWGAVDSYGQPAAVETFPDFEPRHPHESFNYASAKKSAVPTVYPTHKTGLTADKLQKINYNLNKLKNYMNHQQRSSEILPQFNGLDVYREMLKKGTFIPTPVVTDNEIGVLPAELLPDLDTTTSTTTTTTTTEKPKTTTVETRRKDVKFYLRGNKIIQV